MTSVQYTARHAGPITLHIDTQAADVRVVADPAVTGTIIEVSTPDTSGPSMDAVRRTEFHDQGHEVHLKLREGVDVGAGQVVTGVTIVNGVIYGAGSNAHVSAGITVRAITEPGSTVVVRTMSGDVVTKGVGFVRARTMSGDIEVTGLHVGAALKTMSGDIRVAGAPGGRAQVTASSMSGDVTGSGVDLHGRSMSGRVRQVSQ